MTEKRFTYMEQFNGFCDVYDDGKVLSCMKLEYVEKTVNLLNDFCKEIDVLNYEITSLQRKADKIRRDNIALCEENEQLKQLIDTRITVGDNYRKLKEYINELLTKKYNHYEEMKKTIRNKETQRIYTNILKVIKDLQEDIDTEWGDEVRMTEKRVKNIGELKEIIKDLPNELPIEVEVHKMSGEYKLDHIYRCGNDNGEPIVSFYVKYVW